MPLDEKMHAPYTQATSPKLTVELGNVKAD
jgi:hypothetical protein